MKGMKVILCILTVFFVIQLAGENLIDVVNEAELHIRKIYNGELAQKLAMDKLQHIALDIQKTDEAKMEEIRREFLTPKKEDEITETNAYRLIWTPPISWNIHSIAIAYDVDKTYTHVISGETLESKKITHIKSNEKGKKSATGKAASVGTSMEGGVSWTSWLKINPRIQKEAHVNYKADWNESKTELWSKQWQEQLTNSFEEITKDIQSTRVTRCHLTFAIDFYNSCNEDLTFSPSSTIPIYMGGMLILEARPENIGNSQMFIIPHKETKTIKFRGEISTTQAYRLLEGMKTDAPTIRPQNGQLNFDSPSLIVKNSVQEALNVSYSIIRCGTYEYKIRSQWNNKNVTLREALWAINALCEKKPFGIEGDKCISMCGETCGPHPRMAVTEVYPIVEMDGRFFSCLGKEQLDSELQEKSIRFYMGSLGSYLDSNDYASNFYKLLLKELLSMVEQDKDGEVKYLLGKMYDSGKGVFSDTSKAVEYWNKAAEQGNPQAQNSLGWCYFSGKGGEKNTTKAVEWFRKAIEQGHVEAQNNLGGCYEEGEGVEKDLLKAFEWFRKAAEQGNAGAQFNLGRYYHSGMGIPMNKEKAIYWFRKAAEQGNAMAQTWLGVFYFKGDGIPIDKEKGIDWIRKAAEQGEPDAQFYLGMFYDRGDGIIKDKSKAFEWYRRAAEQGVSNAQYCLGMCYDNGDGIMEDMAKAIDWYRKAAEQKNEKALSRLSEMCQTPNQFNGTAILPGEIELELVRVKAGSFVMGSPKSEYEQFFGLGYDEKQHYVTITRDYWIGKFEVTQKQWKAIMGNNPSKFKNGDNYPVEQVSCNDAIRFCAKLTEHEQSAGRLPKKYIYTLPTEAQWEYAARGGHKSNAYHVYSGEDYLDIVGWYKNNSANSTHLVGQKKPNELGLFDMSGNVTEWCIDWYGRYPTESVSNPTGPLKGAAIISRGGSYDDSADNCRSGKRNAGDPTYVVDRKFGFRVALVCIQ